MATAMSAMRSTMAFTLDTRGAEASVGGAQCPQKAAPRWPAGGAVFRARAGSGLCSARAKTPQSAGARWSPPRPPLPCSHHRPVPVFLQVAAARDCSRVQCPQGGGGNHLRGSLFQRPLCNSSSLIVLFSHANSGITLLPTALETSGRCRGGLGCPNAASLVRRRGETGGQKSWVARGTPRGSEHQGGAPGDSPTPTRSAPPPRGVTNTATAEPAPSRGGPPPSQSGNGAAVEGATPGRGTGRRSTSSTSASNGLTGTSRSSSGGGTQGRGGAEQQQAGQGSWFQNPNNILFALSLPFLVLGATFLGSFFARQPRGYQATLRFPRACGVTVGTPVRVRGIAVGQVVALNPSLDGVNAVVEIRDEATGIPRRASFVANQSGLAGEPLIDITPEPPVAHHTHSPLDVEACRREGSILCAGDTVHGDTGVSVDELVGLWVRMGRKTEAERAKRAAGKGSYQG